MPPSSRPGIWRSRGHSAPPARTMAPNSSRRVRTGTVPPTSAPVLTRLEDAGRDRLDGHGIVVDAEHAGRFAGRGTQAARPLGETVGGVEAVDGLAPAVAVHEVVPVGNEVTQRTALVAEGDAAVHAAG